MSYVVVARTLYQKLYSGTFYTCMCVCNEGGIYMQHVDVLSEWQSRKGDSVRRLGNAKPQFSWEENFVMGCLDRHKNSPIYCMRCVKYDDTGLAELFQYFYFPAPVFVSSLNTVWYHMKQQKKKVFFKKKAKHTEWQLPQFLAGALIKTKLVSFSEQTWQALSREAFFPITAKILTECRCSRNVYKGGGTADLTSLFLSIVYASLHMCVYLCICACLSSKPQLFSCCTRGSTPSSLSLHTSASSLW